MGGTFPTSSRELQGLGAVVTGSSRGIGRAVALTLAERGANLIVHGQSPSPEARAVVEQARRGGAEAHLLTADLRDFRQGDSLLEQAWSALGGVDLWVNNAGADILTAPNAELAFDEKLRLLIETDLVATIRLARAAGQRMRDADGGHVINVGWDQAQIGLSLAGMGGETAQLFAAVKGGVMSFTKSLALSLAPKVRVNCVAPGWIRTAWGENASELWQQRVVRDTPLARWGTPQDVANTVSFLASPAAAFLTGQIINVNGGAVC